MDGDRRNWPLIIGVTAGVVSGVIAGVYLYAVRTHHDPETRLRDAADIIAQCREKIKEIEDGLETLKKPISA